MTPTDPMLLVYIGAFITAVILVTAVLERFGPEHPPRWLGRLLGD